MIVRTRSRVTRVGKRNQVTIPAALLRELGVEPGDQVEVALKDDGAIGITKAVDPFERLRELRETLRRNHPCLPPGPANDEEFAAMIREARIERSIKADEDDQRIMREWRERNS